VSTIPVSTEPYTKLMSDVCNWGATSIAGRHQGIMLWTCMLSNRQGALCEELRATLL
jgi:hypothetical protein